MHPEGRIKDTGYFHRSQKHFNQDYGTALAMFNKWINAGEPQGILDRPLFTEVREGHTQAMKQLGLLDKYDPNYFSKTKERQKQRHRERYHKDQRTISHNQGSPKEFNWQAPNAELFMMMADSVRGIVCFGCGQQFKKGERFGKVKKFGKKNEFWVHYDQDCANKASENFKAGIK